MWVCTILDLKQGAPWPDRRSGWSLCQIAAGGSRRYTKMKQGPGAEIKTWTVGEHRKTRTRASTGTATSTLKAHKCLSRVLEYNQQNINTACACLMTHLNYRFNSSNSICSIYPSESRSVLINILFICRECSTGIQDSVGHTFLIFTELCTESGESLLVWTSPPLDLWLTDYRERVYTVCTLYLIYPPLAPVEVPGLLIQPCRTGLAQCRHGGKKKGKSARRPDHDNPIIWMGMLHCMFIRCWHRYWVLEWYLQYIRTSGRSVASCLSLYASAWS